LALVCIGWLPLTSWVAGYVQPDNLSFALVTVILWFGLRWQRSGRFADALAVAVFLGLLFFTKQHYALCCWVAFLLAALPRLASKMASRPIASGAVLLVVPELCFKASFLATYSPGLGFASNSFARVSATLSPAHVRVLLGGVLDGISSAFFGGESFQDYWLRFGERGETLFPARIYHLVSPLVLAAMLACFVLVGAGRLHVVRRILRVFRKRSFLAGLRLTTSSLPLNIYVITTCVLTFAFVQSNEVLWLEGRYWLPLIVPLIVLGSRLGDAASPPVRPLLRRVFLGGVAAFCAVSALFGIGAIGRAYYQPAAAVLTFDPMANIIAVRRSGEAVTATAQVSLRRGESIDITGYAIDPRTGFPARSVFARIDDGARLQAKVGLPLPLVENAFSDDRILDSGFELRLRADRYGLGTHTLRLYVAGVGLSALPLRDKLGFRVM